MSFSISSELTCKARAMLALAILATLVVVPAQAGGVSGMGTWESTLQGRDLDGNAGTFEAYYDATLDITWLADTVFAETSGHASIANMNWDAAQAWVSQLNVHGTTGWRLPSMTDTGAPGCDHGFSGTDCGYNVDTSTSELAHLFRVTLGNSGPYDTSGKLLGGLPALKNSGPFVYLVPGFYWTGVSYETDAGQAWQFQTLFGRQRPVGKNVEGAIPWAVRSGDVSAVPESQTGVQMMVGLVVALLARRKLVR